MSTIKTYIGNIIDVVKYISDLPPHGYRLRRAETTMILKTLRQAERSLSRTLVQHQINVKAAKEKVLITKEELAACIEKSHAEMPHLLGG